MISTYTAKDGTTFVDKQECIEYESGTFLWLVTARYTIGVGGRTFSGPHTEVYTEEDYKVYLDMVTVKGEGLTAHKVRVQDYPKKYRTCLECKTTHNRQIHTDCPRCIYD